MNEFLSSLTANVARIVTNQRRRVKDEQRPTYGKLELTMASRLTRLWFLTPAKGTNKPHCRPGDISEPMIPSTNNTHLLSRPTWRRPKKADPVDLGQQTAAPVDLGQAIAEPVDLDQVTASLVNRVVNREWSLVPESTTPVLSSEKGLYGSQGSDVGTCAGLQPRTDAPSAAAAAAAAVRSRRLPPPTAPGGGDAEKVQRRWWQRHEMEGSAGGHWALDWSRAGAGQIDAAARSTLQLERSVTGPIANQPSSRRSRRYTNGLQGDRWGCRWLADTFPDVSGTRKLTQEAQKKKKLGKKFKRRSSSFYTY